MNESAYKPGSVVDDHSSGACVTANLKQPTRIHCGSQRRIPIWPCSKRGLPCHELLPVARCALTAPFQPYRQPKLRRRYIFCCTFRRLSPPRRYLALYPMEPGLSSPRLRAERPPSRLNCKNNQYFKKTQARAAIFLGVALTRIDKDGFS